MAEPHQNKSEEYIHDYYHESKAIGRKERIIDQK